MEGDVFKGVMYGVERAEFLLDIIKTLKMGETGSTYILSSTGDTLAHEDNSLVYDRVNPIKNAETDPSWKDIAAQIKGISGDNRPLLYI